jgi:hypothetical protein
MQYFLATTLLQYYFSFAEEKILFSNNHTYEGNKIKTGNKARKPHFTAQRTTSSGLERIQYFSTGCQLKHQM